MTVSKHDAGSEYLGEQMATAVKNDNSVIPLAVQTLTYNDVNEPEEITEGDWEMAFNYGPDKGRIRTTMTNTANPALNETRYYAHDINYESVTVGGVRYHMVYVPLTENTLAIVVDEEAIAPPGGGSGGEQGLMGGDPNEGPGGGDPPPWVADCGIYFVYTDHLGSWLHVTDAVGHVIATQNFDAWGRRRDTHSKNINK